MRKKVARTAMRSIMVTKKASEPSDEKSNDKNQ